MLATGRNYHAPWEHCLNVNPTANTHGKQVNGHATNAHEKGAYTELFAATTYDWYGFWVLITGTWSSGNSMRVLMDIAVGAGGSEEIILPDWLIGFRSPQHPPAWFMPFYIPRGTRIAARSQFEVPGNNHRCTLWGVTGASGLPGTLFTRADAYGIDSANSSGTSHTPGNSGAESTPADIGTPTSRKYGAVMLGTHPVGGTVTSQGYHWELMVDSNTLAEWYSSNTTAEQVFGPYPPTPTYVSIPASKQLQIRAECGGTAQANDVAFYCFY